MLTLIRILFILILLPTTLRAAENQAVILMYHHFGVDEYPSTNVSLSQFEAHLEYLEQGGYEIWPLAKVVEYIKQRKPFPSRVIAITVDDAYLSVYTEAYPRLQARGWPFTVFVATDGVDRHFKAYMTWAQMREMESHGVTFANHSATHDYLVRRLAGESDADWQQRIRADIQRAQRRLTEELGEAPPMLFAYPYGEYDTPLADLIAELGYSAFGQQSGPAGLGDDTRALPRYPMAEKFAAIGDFRQKVASLAFPIIKVEPWDPLITNAQTAPRLTVALGESDARLNQLHCYLGGDSLPLELGEDHKSFSVQAEAPLPLGRSRYNCTAPSTQRGRYYWYSHPWLRNSD